MTASDLKSAILSAARRIGFDLVGVAPPGDWPTGDALAPWLAAGHAGGMAYMARDPAARADPRRRFPWAKAAVLCALSYRTDEACIPVAMGPPGQATGTPPASRRPVSRYAWGEDYHEVLAAKLRALKAEALALGGGAEAHYWVDTGPVLERAAAAAAGLGWIAKNTMLIHERQGSYFFLGALFVPYELPFDRAAPGRCGTCHRCLDACPTRAFVAPYLLDARRCISYLTIELRGPIPHELRPLMGEMIFGCDICQEVCPWNERALRREAPAPLPMFRARPGLSGGRLEELVALLELTPEGFRERFRGSPVRRAKRAGLARNVCVALGNRGDPAALPALRRALAADPDALVRGHAAWAVGALAAKHADLRPDARAALGAALGDADPSVQEEVASAMRSFSDADQRRSTPD